MKITRQKVKNRRQYFIDGRLVKQDKLNEFCNRFLSAEGLAEMWRKLIDEGECTLDLDFTPKEEKSLLEIKDAEIAHQRAVIAALEKKLMQFRIKAAKYDGLMAVMKTA